MRRRRGPALGFALAAAALGAAPAPSIMPLREVVPGMRGVARTVVQGDLPVDLPLEIIGLAPSLAGPGRDVLIARLVGAEADRAGVASGMSGSPVFLDGRLAGALAYRLSSFSSEAIAGITPIEQMLSIGEGPPPPASEAQGGALPAAGLVYPVAALAGLAPWPEETGAAPRDSATPLLISGVSAEARTRLEGRLAAAGLAPLLQAVSPGSAGEPSDVGHGLQQGDAVSAVLVQGDMLAAASGTVTLVDGERVWAMGHPLFRLGSIDVPMAKATVLLTIPSLAGSFKFLRVGAVVGAFHQDRAAGLFGRLHAAARLLPVEITVQGAGREDRRALRFEVARVRELTPALVELVIANALLTADPGSVAGTLSLSGALRIGPQATLPLELRFSSDAGGLPPVFRAARHVAGLLATLEGTPAGWGTVSGVELECTLDPLPQGLALEAARLDRDSVRPGEVLGLTAQLRDRSDGMLRRERFDLEVPPLPKGTRLEVLVGDAAAIAAEDGGALVAAVASARHVEAVARALSRLPFTDRLYFRVTRPAAGLITQGDLWLDVPPSIRLMFSAGSGRPPTGPARGIVAAEDRNLGTPVSGQVRLSLVID